MLRKRKETNGKANEEQFEIKSTVRKFNRGTGWRIFLPQSQAQKFFSIIGPCPVPSMEYKWKI